MENRISFGFGRPLLVVSMLATSLVTSQAFAAATDCSKYVSETDGQCKTEGNKQCEADGKKGSCNSKLVGASKYECVCVTNTTLKELTPRTVAPKTVAPKTLVLPKDQ
jgi:hypothetical protein